MATYFGERIKLARKQAGLTQKQLSERLGVANTSVSNWEKNVSRPDPDTITRICEELSIDPGFLFADYPKNKKSPSAEDTAPEDELDVKIMRVVRELPEESKKALLDFLNTWPKAD